MYGRKMTVTLEIQHGQGYPSDTGVRLDWGLQWQQRLSTSHVRPQR